MARLGIASGVLAVALAGTPGGPVPDHAARAQSAPDQPKPNIVLVLSDDQRWDTLWAMPGVRETLARHGVTFVNSFVVNPKCCPSRASLLTGRYSHGTGVYRNTPPSGGFVAFRDRTTIATALRAQGYTTALVGRYLNGYGAEGGHTAYVPPGWDEWAAFHGTPRYYRYRLALGRRVVQVGGAPERYSTHVLGELALSFLRRAEEPFFLVFAPFAPHAPATPPPDDFFLLDAVPGQKPARLREADRSDKPAYVRTLTPLTAAQDARLERFRRRQILATAAVDEIVRRMVAELESRGATGRTLVAFTSDNGMAWGAHELDATSKSAPYEEAIRVPLVVRYDPLTAGRARRETRLVVNLDLAPTFAALAGATLPDVDGRDLRPLLRPDSSPTWRRDFLIEHLLEGKAKRARVPTYCALRSRRYKYVVYQTGEVELYDLARDPAEMRNLHGRPDLRAVEQTLRGRLQAACSPRPPGYTALDHNRLPRSLGASQRQRLGSRPRNRSAPRQSPSAARRW